jgi:hypothetical protein
VVILSLWKHLLWWKSSTRPVFIPVFIKSWQCQRFLDEMGHIKQPHSDLASHTNSRVRSTHFISIQEVIQNLIQ